jgi:hypothetical protein
MTEKERIDTISIMYSQAWENFNRRRDFEIKLSFGLYTILCLSIAGLIVYGDYLKITPTFLIGVIFFGFVLVFLHGYWCFKANRVNHLDRKIAVHFERIMQDLSNSEYPENLLELIAANTLSNNKTPSLLRNWSHLIQIFVSFFLYLSLVYTTWIAL